MFPDFGLWLHIWISWPEGLGWGLHLSKRDVSFSWGCVLRLSDKFPGLIPRSLCTPELGWESSVKVGMSSHGDFGNPVSRNIAAEIFISAVRPVIPESSPSFPLEPELSSRKGVQS